MGVFGQLIVDDWRCYTIERPDHGNQRYVSCIPEGVYELVLGRFNRGGYDAWELRNVPGRNLIKIHIANIMHHVSGCVGLGSGLGFIDGFWAVTDSRHTFQEFMRKMAPDRQARISIANAPARAA